MNFCVDNALKYGITSYAKLRKTIYEEWKERWYPKYHAHYCHSACKIATAILKNFRKRKRKGLTDKDKPEIRRDFLKFEELSFKFEGDRVKIAISLRNWITVDLVFGEHQRGFIEAWKRGELDWRINH